MKKFSRPLCLLLSLIIFCTFLVVPSSAAENLIDPNLSHWDNAITSNPDSVEGTYEMRVFKFPNANIFQVSPSYLTSADDVRIYLGWIVDKSILLANKTYTFSMHVLSPSEIRSATGYTWSDNSITEMLGDGYSIGFGVVDVDGGINLIEEFISVTPDNYLNFSGTDFVHSFVCPSYSGGEPCIIITAASTKGFSNIFFDDSLMLIDNEQENSDSLLSKLFQWFQDRFDDLSSWFDGLGNRISGFFDNLGNIITDGINNVLDGIGGWFQKLGNLILYLTWSDEVPDNPFQSEDGPLDKVEGFFDGLIDYLRNIKTDLLNLIDSVTAGIHVFDLFTERFPWVKSLCLFAFALIIFSRFVGI